MYWRAWSVTKLKTGSSRPKTARTADACMVLACRYSFAAHSTQLFVLFWPSINKLPLFSFVAYSVTVQWVQAHEYVYLSILRSSVSTFSVNLAITVRNVTSRNKYNDVQLQNQNLKFGVMLISHTWSNFRQNQHINDHKPVEQLYQIWRKNFQALPCNHILRVGSFF